MKLLFAVNIYLYVLLSLRNDHHFIYGEEIQISDNEFAEFEVEDDHRENDNGRKETGINTDNEDIFEQSNHVIHKSEYIDTEPSAEFSFLADDEEFAHVEKPNLDIKNANHKPGDIKPLTFADIPSHFRSNWSSYQVESIALLIILIYILNYLYGKSKNYSIAHKWFISNCGRLEKQFALVGDDGIAQDEITSQIIRETEFSYSIWCTGRVGCKGMLTQLKLSKRQDLLGVALNLIRPMPDKVIHKIDLEPGEMDSFVIIFGQRKGVQKAVKEMNDLSSYVTEKKNFEKIQLPASFCVYAEIAETVPAIIDATTIQFIKKFERLVDYIHLTDQYSGPKQQDEQLNKLPETSSTLIFNYLMGEPDESTQELLLNFVFYILDKVRHYRLSKEGKIRADRKRQDVQENFLKLTHQQRQEAAQTRREEKTRERKQRVMEEEDPERQKRLEKIELKRDAKLKQPKIKQFKIK